MAFVSHCRQEARSGHGDLSLRGKVRQARQPSTGSPCDSKAKNVPCKGDARPKSNSEVLVGQIKSSRSYWITLVPGVQDTAAIAQRARGGAGAPTVDEAFHLVIMTERYLKQSTYLPCFRAASLAFEANTRRGTRSLRAADRVSWPLLHHEG